MCTAAFSTLIHGVCGAYLAGAIVIDAVFVSGLLDPFRDALNKFLYLLQFREENSTILEVKSETKLYAF